MAVTTQNLSLRGEAASDSAAVDALILNAVNTLIERAESTSGLEVKDKRTPNSSECSGVLMDCEFGLMLLAARAALLQRGHIDGALADGGRVREVTLTLAAQTLDRIGARLAKFRSGALDNARFIFAGEPYTAYRARTGERFSANLDAAMLIVGFLAAAMQTYDAEMRASKPDWIAKRFTSPNLTNLRDVALLACRDGFEYASQCIVAHESGGTSFTCDPITNQESTRQPNQPPGGLNDDDRLFFTWSLAETVNELVEVSDWSAYLDTIVDEPGRSVATEAKALLEKLNDAIGAASEWSRHTFTPRLAEFKQPAVDDLVAAAKGIPTEQALPPELERQCESVRESVLHVYHFSQYGAIRSIRDATVSLDEVRNLADTLETLVSVHIVGGGLDAAEHESLYRLLTRDYSLGWNAETRAWKQHVYRDDAYFPLVVRALAGLLTRTLTSLSSRAPWAQVARVVESFRRAVASLTTAMVKRQPEGEPALWAFSRRGRYALYATQRTVFALLAYQDFLDRLDKFEQAPAPAPPVAATEGAIPSQLVRELARIADALHSPDFLGALGARNAGVPPGQPAAPVTAGPPDPALALLPKAAWARKPLEDWLRGFNTLFEKQGVEENLQHWITKLLRIREAQKKGELGSEILWNQIAEDVSMEALTSYDGDQLRPILFDYLLRNYLRRVLELKPAWSSPTLVLIPANDGLWNNIDKALASKRPAGRQAKP